MLDLSSESSGQFLIHMPAMADGDEANDTHLAIDGVDDSKAADAILPQPIDLTLERLPAFGVVRNSTNRSFDGLFEVGMERANDVRHMRGGVTG